MAFNSRTWLLISTAVLFPMVSIAFGRMHSNSGRVKAVNLGGWLVTEVWIKPSLFDGIQNKDLLDGTGLQFKFVKTGKYLAAELGGGSSIVANRSSASGWETFRLWRINEFAFNFRVFNKDFVGLDVNCNGAQAKSEVLVTADYAGTTGWGNNDPSVFVITVPGKLEGEFQVTDGYGPKKTPQVMGEHWNTFIVEDDFHFISTNGLNAVRIPVGWWIASDPTPPHPYVGGSLRALDKAFLWAQYLLLLFCILAHLPPYSYFQKHLALKMVLNTVLPEMALRNGVKQMSIQQTVDVIDFLTASRYAKSPSLYAVELINEPFLPGASLQNVTKFYTAGYAAVRKHSSTEYVVLSNRLRPMTQTGEWAAEWNVKGAKKEDYQRFANAQLEVLGRATFGWAYWTLKNVNNHWSLEWMIKNGYIKLT